MSQFDPARTLKALALLRSIAEKIQAGAEFTNTELGRKCSEFYVETRDRAKYYGVATVITPGQLVFLEGISVRLKVRKKK